MLKTLQGLPITLDMKSKFLSFPNKALYMNWLPLGLTSSHPLLACSKPAILSALCLSNFTSKFLLQGLGLQLLLAGKFLPHNFTSLFPLKTLLKCYL